MERLTNETLDNAISVYETTMRVTGDNGEPCYLPIDEETLCFLKELKAYRDAEEQGLLLRLPCKKGYMVHGGHVDELKLISVNLEESKPVYRYESICDLDDLPYVIELSEEKANEKICPSFVEAHEKLLESWQR